ncbi:MAG TPA: glycosyltransferase family 2 protein, partial [Paenalcaligenes sp.]|nr:glycosyltransferase family 2 protein [Paenalcaligenes sp.]
MRLSVTIITKNEAAHIIDCIHSVAFADEVIVLDSGSTDDTCALAEQAGAKVFKSADWPGFGPQKNRALDYAQGEWVLSLDADERISSELAQQILAVINPTTGSDNRDIPDAYELSRMSCYGGRWMQYSGWRPDFILRLFRRTQARFSDDLVHESVQFKGRVGQLQGVIYHYPYDSVETHIKKMDHYSTAAAQSLWARGRKISVVGILLKMFWTFVRVYIIRRGFLDGKQGLILALMAATGNMYRYSKL